MDPAEVYIFGTLAQGANGLDVVGSWRNPNTYVVGFDGSTDGSRLQFLGDKLLYNLIAYDSVHQFVPEFQSNLEPLDLDYPLNPKGNDVDIDTQPCVESTAAALAWLTSPDGRLIYQCPDGPWYEDGALVWDGQTLLTVVALGNDGLVLFDRWLTVMDLATGQQLTPDGTNHIGRPLTARAVDDGFHVVVESDVEDIPELWHVTAGAAAKKLGTFPAPPPIRRTTYTKLSAKGELFQISGTLDLKHDVILRRTLDGESAVVYSEATDPRIKLHASYLFTGP